MEIKHVCQSCGDVMAVHEHESWHEVKDCSPGCERCAGSARAGQDALPREQMRA
jgi:hypothetical protein